MTLTKAELVSIVGDKCSFPRHESFQTVEQHCPVTPGTRFLFMVDMFNFSKVQRLARSPQYFR